MSIWSGGGWLGLAVLIQKCDFWKVLGLARNPSKKMRLDESFRMVQSACHFVAYIKSYGQKTKVISRVRIWPVFGIATSGSVTPHVAIIS